MNCHITRILCTPQVFAFVLNTTKATWLTFDWDKLTTIVLFDFVDSELVCHAHQHNVRVLHNGESGKSVITHTVMCPFADHSARRRSMAVVKL